MNKILVCHALEYPITCEISASVVNDGGTLTLNIKYARDDSYCYCSGFRFRKIRAYRYKADAYRSLWEVEFSSCKLIEILESRWVKELRSKSMYGKDDDCFIMRHFMFSFGEEGCFEVIAELWELLPEKKIDNVGYFSHI